MVDVVVKEVNGAIGLGVFASRDFKQGELVVRSTGEVIPYQTEHSIQIDWDRHLEVEPPARYLNHSCEPNLGIRTNADGFPDFVAMRDIGKGEELTWDYAMSEWTHYERSDPALEFDLTCRCGSENCRGRLGYYSELPDELKERYRGYISDYLVEWEERRGGTNEMIKGGNNVEEKSNSTRA